jgi:hypothetical protein
MLKHEEAPTESFIGDIPTPETSTLEVAQSEPNLNMDQLNQL